MTGTRLLTALAETPADHPFAAVWSDDTAALERFTVGQLRAQAWDIDRFLRAHGVGPGDRVGLVLPQGMTLMAAFAGALRLGAVPTILPYPNFKLDPEKYREGLSGVTQALLLRAVMIDADFPEEFAPDLRVEAGAIVTLPAGSHAADAAWPLVRVDPEALAFLQQSSGTTGLQKTVAITHGALDRQLSHLADALTLRHDDVVYSWLPLYHDMGLVACFLLPLAFGLPIVMQSPDVWVVSPQSMLELVDQECCTLTWLPNFAFSYLAKRVPADTRARHRLHSLRAIVSCSEPIQAASLDAFAAAFADAGLRTTTVQSSYAMAENVFAVTQSSMTAPPMRLVVDGETLRRSDCVRVEPSDHAAALTLVSSGRPVGGTSLRIEGADGRVAGDDVVGEILIRGDVLFDGYVTADTRLTDFRDGWFRTGDLGFTHGGELFVTGRKKDLIIIGGHNVYPQDVEAIACDHALVHDGRAVALGLPNQDLGTDDLVLVVETHTETNAEQSDALERTLRQDVVGRMGVSVRRIFVKPPRWLPKSTSGKPARTETRRRLLSEHPELSS